MSTTTTKHGDHAIAAACYAYAAAHQARYGDETMLDIEAPKEWPFSQQEWQVGTTARATLMKSRIHLTKEESDLNNSDE
jgi:hypothetical protein